MAEAQAKAASVAQEQIQIEKQLRQQAEEKMRAQLEEKAQTYGQAIARLEEQLNDATEAKRLAEEQLAF